LENEFLMLIRKFFSKKFSEAIGVGKLPKYLSIITSKNNLIVATETFNFVFNKIIKLKIKIKKKIIKK
jgi:hypothetical protein